ncbi:MAG: hypothetical protein KA179_08350, partial [Sulfuritalea sp.]|nr:hypothetical protein [Sulfuritalea sp.]
MADKQSLYELLGLTDKASPEDIQNAHAAMRQALELLPDSEDKHNRIAILNTTRDMLLDRRQRAGYDRRQRDRRDNRPRDAEPVPGRGWLKPVLASVLIGCVAYAAGRYMVPASTPASPSTAQAPIPANAPTAPAGVDDGQPDKLAVEIASLLPPAQSAPATPTPAPTTAVAAPQATAPAAPPQPSLAELLQAAAINSIAESTYAVIGGGGQGTGVAIDRDKLLTNCHVIAPNIHKGPLLAIHAASGKQTVITHAA